MPSAFENFLDWNPGDDFLKGLAAKSSWKGIARLLGVNPDESKPKRRSSSVPGRSRYVYHGPDRGGRPGTARGPALPSNDSGMDINSILAQLQAMQDPSRYMVDQGSLEQQARAAAAAQYDPVISSLRQQMQGTQQRGNYNQKVVGNLFNALANTTLKDIPVQEKYYDEASRSTAQNYKDLEAAIAQQYDESQKYQEDLMKRLNIEAAATDILPQQERDQAFFENLARQEGQTLQSALGQEERGAVEFTRQGAQMARAEGTQRRADIAEQVREMVNALQAQIGANEAAKQQAYVAGLGDLSSQAEQRAMQLSQRDFENYLAQIKLGQSLRRDQRDELAAIAKDSVDVTKSLADVPGRALSLGLPEQSAQEITESFMEALNNRTLMSGLDPGTNMAMTKEALADIVEEQGRSSGLSEREVKILKTIALEYFGRR